MSVQEEIQRVSEELNSPSTAKLFAVLRSQGVAVKLREVEAYTKRQAVRQVQAPRYGFTGKIAAHDINDRWFADLIDFTAAPSDGGEKVGLHPTNTGFRFVLVVQDVFSRFLWCEPLRTKAPVEVAAAFDDIVARAHGKPRSLTTDQGAEFDHQFQEVLARHGIDARQKDKFDINAISTIDTAIGNFKKALARDCRANHTANWQGRLQKVVDGQNRIPNEEYLDGVAPAKVASSPELIAYLKQKNAGFDAHNQNAMQGRKDKLESTGHFREMIAAGKFTRGFKPRWSSEVHRVAKVDGAYVTDENGKTTLSKFAQAIPEDTTNDAGPIGIEAAGSKQTEFKQRSELKHFHDLTVAFLRGKGHEGIYTSILAKYLNAAGFQDAARKAGINMKSPIAAFLRVFPDSFVMSTSSKGGTSTVRLKDSAPAPASAPASASSGSGAGSSSGHRLGHIQ